MHKTKTWILFENLDTLLFFRVYNQITKHIYTFVSTHAWV